MIVRDIHGCIYKRLFTLAYGTRDEINAWFRKQHPTDKTDALGPQSVGHYCVWREDKSGRETDYVFIRQGVETRNQITAVITHEAVHRAAHVLTSMELAIKESEEAYTYYVEWIVLQILNVIYPQRKKNTAKAKRHARARAKTSRGRR